MKAIFILISFCTMLNIAPLRAEMITDDSVESFETILDQGVASFCRDRLASLRRASARAAIETSRGNTALSVHILLEGLINTASRITPRYMNTLTSQAVLRGIRIVKNLEVATNDRIKDKTINHFLFRYYDFISDVSRDLDVPYYQPGKCGFCQSREDDQFEENFITFAQEQLNMVLDAMTTNDDGIIYPLGSPRILITAIKLTTSAMARDLSSSLGAAHYACTIQELADISREATRYLKGTSYSADDFEAIQELASRSRDVSDSMNNRCD